MSGAGTELKQLFMRLGVSQDDVDSDDAGCGCSRLAAKMDQKGPDWCRDNYESLCGEILKKAQGRGFSLPGTEATIRLCVWLAIRRAGRGAKKKNKETKPQPEATHDAPTHKTSDATDHDKESPASAVR